MLLNRHSPQTLSMLVQMPIHTESAGTGYLIVTFTQILIDLIHTTFFDATPNTQIFLLEILTLLSLSYVQ